MSLRLDWCSYKAAKYAVMKWHYSKTMPSGRLLKIGVWEDGKFIGVVIFGRGAAPNQGKRYMLTNEGFCELNRIALNTHKSPVSKIIKISINLLKQKSPGSKLVISYADDEQGHVGGIYQAANWVYVGKIRSSWTANGLHNRTFDGSRKIAIQRLGRNTIFRNGGIKYKYLYPLTKEIADLINPLARPYPKRAGSIDADAPATHAGEGGSNPTSALETEMIGLEKIVKLTGKEAINQDGKTFNQCEKERSK